MKWFQFDESELSSANIDDDEASEFPVSSMRLSRSYIILVKLKSFDFFVIIFLVCFMYFKPFPTLEHLHLLGHFG